MTALSIGLLGSGRVGRNLIRILTRSNDLELAAVVDPSEPEQIEYLLKFDTLLGRFPEPLHLDQGDLVIGAKRIALQAGADVAPPDWRALGVDVVVEATGKPAVAPRSTATSRAAPDASCSARRRPTRPTSPWSSGSTTTALRPEHRIVSNASCTAHCAAPVLKVLSRQLRHRAGLPDDRPRLHQPRPPRRRARRRHARAAGPRPRTSSRRRPTPPRC